MELSITQHVQRRLKTYSYDDAFRITGLPTQRIPRRAGRYDLLDRLNSARQPGTTLGYTYDANGNCVTETGSSPSILGGGKSSSESRLRQGSRAFCITPKRTEISCEINQSSSSGAAGLSLYLNPAQSIGGGEDGDVLKGLQIEQIKIARNDEIGASTDSASKHMIVIGIATDWSE